MKIDSHPAPGDQILTLLTAQTWIYLGRNPHETSVSPHVSWDSQVPGTMKCAMYQEAPIPTWGSTAAKGPAPLLDERVAWKGTPVRSAPAALLLLPGDKTRPDCRLWRCLAAGLGGGGRGPGSRDRRAFRSTVLPRAPVLPISLQVPSVPGQNQALAGGHGCGGCRSRGSRLRALSCRSLSSHLGDCSRAAHRALIKGGGVLEL